jgi:hypothetical protein
MRLLADIGMSELAFIHLALGDALYINGLKSGMTIFLPGRCVFCADLSWFLNVCLSDYSLAGRSINVLVGAGMGIQLQSLFHQWQSPRFIPSRYPGHAQAGLPCHAAFFG